MMHTPEGASATCGQGAAPAGSERRIPRLGACEPTWSCSERAGTSVTKVARQREQAYSAKLQQGAFPSSPRVHDAISRAEGQQPSRGQTRDVSLGQNCSRTVPKSLHTKTTNSVCCTAKIVSRRISQLVCCTAQNRVDRCQTYPQRFAVHSKALLYQGVHVLHHSSLLHCLQCLWSGLPAQRLVLLCFLQSLTPAPHCCLGRRVFAVLQAHMEVPSHLHKLKGRCFLPGGSVPPVRLAVVYQRR